MDLTSDRLFMIKSIKLMVKDWLAYCPLRETEHVRYVINKASVSEQSFCPSYEGDFLYLLIRKNGFKTCLETGFYTGSTALYLLAGVIEVGGHVTSICLDRKDVIDKGIHLLSLLKYENFHKLVRKNSNEALPELFLAGKRFDFVFVDGWKTFDHLVLEIYYINQMLQTGGMVVFDDSYMPSVRKAILILQRYYGYEEVTYSAYNQSIRLRFFLFLTRLSFLYPYRAFKKVDDTSDQLPFKSWNFYSKI